jgi:hypothetical protein
MASQKRDQTGWAGERLCRRRSRTGGLLSHGHENILHKKAPKPVLATGRRQDETDARTPRAWRSPNQPAAIVPAPLAAAQKNRTWNRPGRQQTKQGATVRCTSGSFPFFHPDYTVGVGMGRSCNDCSTAPHSCIRHNGKRAGEMACRCRHGPSARGLVDGSTYRRSGIGVVPSPCPEGCYEIVFIIASAARRVKSAG